MYEVEDYDEKPSILGNIFVKIFYFLHFLVIYLLNLGKLTNLCQNGK